MHFLHLHYVNAFAVYCCNMHKELLLCKYLVCKYFCWSIFVTIGLNASQLIHVFFCRAFQPIILSYFIQLFSRSDKDNVEVELHVCGVALVLTTFITVLLSHHGNFRFSLTGMRCRIAVSSLVYRKVSYETRKTKN